jgi:4-amino-4-deoxy-L-arabinose transferase-like glycosyltransferase
MQWLENNARSVLALALTLALALGVWRINAHPTTLTVGQTDNFWTIANHVLDGDGYTLCYPLYFPFCPDGAHTPTAMREPVPVLLFAASAAVSGRSLVFTLHVQLLLFLGTVLLVQHFTRRFLTTGAAGIAAVAWAAYLPASGLLDQLSADITGTFFLLLSTCTLLKALEERTPRWWLLSGLSLGIAALSRSALLLMALPWCYAAFQASGGFRRWRAASVPPVILVAGMLAVMSPWAVRNQVVFGKAWLGTSMNGYNIWRMNSQVATDEPLHYVDSFEADTMSRVLLARRTDLTGNENEAAMDRVYTHEAMAAIKSNPVKYLRLCGYHALLLFTNMDVKQSYGVALTMGDRAAFVQQMFYLALGFLGMWSLRARGRVWILAIAVQVLGYSAMVAQMRYLIPVMPFFLVFGASAIIRWMGPPQTRA